MSFLKKNSDGIGLAKRKLLYKKNTAIPLLKYQIYKIKKILLKRNHLVQLI